VLLEYDALGDGEDHRVIGFIETWKNCPDKEQLDAYTHLVMSFAVTYTWAEEKNQCSHTCKFEPITGCIGSSLGDFVDSMHRMDKKVLVAVGGAGMGRAEMDDNNNCWDHCLNKTDYLISQTADMVETNNFDGVVIDYEYYLETDQQRQFVVDLFDGVREELDEIGSDKVLSIVPRDKEVNAGSHYYKLLNAIKMDVNFVMMQYYNGDHNLHRDFSGAMAHFDLVVNGVFDGDASRVVLGFCLKDCKPSLSSDKAIKAVQKVQKKAPHHGGVFLWAVSEDDGMWAKPVSMFYQSEQHLAKRE